MTEYTMLDYYATRIEYEENFQKMLKARVGFPRHSKYVKVEFEINKRQIAIMKDLNIFAPDPCPPKITASCEDCTGFYRQTKVKGRYKIKVRAYKICNESHQDACCCHIKSINFSIPKTRSVSRTAISTMSEGA